MAYAVLVALALPCLAFAAVRAHVSGMRDGCANADVPAHSASPQAMGDAVICLVNHQRARYHLPPLLQDPTLTVAAQRYTAEMANRHFFSHIGPGGSTPGTRIRAAGYSGSWFGENIAGGFRTPLAVVNAWMHSRGHCQNILAPMFRNIGVGVAARNKRFTLWTQDFALPRYERAPSGNSRPADSCPHNMGRAA